MNRLTLLAACLVGYSAHTGLAAERVLPAPDLGDVRSQTLPLSMTLTTIEIRGNTVLDHAEIGPVTQRYVGRSITDADLQALRDELTLLYVAKGYLSSGVYVPDQRVTDGRLMLQAVEGQLDEVRIAGNPRVQKALVARRIQEQLSTPLNVNELRDAIQLLQRNSTIKRVDANLQPGARPGSSVLNVSLDELPPRTAYVQVDNHRSESVGAERVTVGFVHQNLLGREDQLSLDVGFSDGTTAGSFGYSTPIGIADTAVRAYYIRDNVDVVESTFESLDIETTTDTYGIALDVPFQRSLDTSFGMTLGFEVKRSESELLGVPFSLSPGAVDGESNVSVALVGLDWLSRSDGQVIALRGVVRRGLDVLDATESERTRFDVSDIDGTFTTFIVQGQLVRRLTDTLQGTVRTLAQLSQDPLLGIEKLAIGGVNTVRGYRENLLVRDNGVAASVELSWQPFLHSSSRLASSLSLVPFIDYGRSWDEDDVDLTSNVTDTDEADYIVGAGIGLRWQPVSGLRVDVYWGDDVDNSFENGSDPRDGSEDHGLQDDGIHFSIEYGMSF